MLDRALTAQFDAEDLNLNQNLIRSPDLKISCPSSRQKRDRGKPHQSMISNQQHHHKMRQQPTIASRYSQVLNRHASPQRD
ncbi:hypothetical protein SynPROS91_01760 [Synechococcus sp. PROS-9-1]|nr:hypothetical protein SynPROS91_01760 [Synechococcus sp. PROS-9-1]